MSLRTVGPIWNCGVWLAIRTNRGVPVPVADNAVDRPLVDVVIEAIDADDELSNEAKYYVLAALEGPTALQELLDGISTPHVPEPSGSQLVEEPVGAFLTSITVAGFRGIGPKGALKLHPAPGITIVSGRNGSGKSSFAEALEFAITGSSHRWENKAKLWADTWRNLHQGDPCEVRVGLTIEGSEPTVVGVDWTSDAALKGCSTWTQVGKHKRSTGTDALGGSLPSNYIARSCPTTKSADCSMRRRPPCTTPWLNSSDSTRSPMPRSDWQRYSRRSRGPGNEQQRACASSRPHCRMRRTIA